MDRLPSQGWYALHRLTFSLPSELEDDLQALAPLELAGARMGEGTRVSHGPLTALAGKVLSHRTSNCLQALALSRPISLA
jgi:hypothetical protein